jgi:hypothetical protein
MTNLTNAQADSMFEYRNGVLYWKIDNCRNKTKGKPAGCIGGDVRYKYLQTSVNKVLIKNHRIIFLLHHGYMPSVIDHINGDTLDNRIENLREATIPENGYNSKLMSNNTSGYKGVTWSKQSRKWLVRVSKEKKRINIGYFESLEQASLAAINARVLLNGEFARHA